MSAKGAINGISLDGSSKTTVILFHGYTGSPNDFEMLPEIMHQKFDVSVRVIRLYGHCTEPEDLLKYSYADYRHQAEEVVKREIRRGVSVIVGGGSFGGLLAAHIASKYKVKGLILVCTPLSLKFPLAVRSLASVLCKIKPMWKKRLFAKERENLTYTFFYDYMPSLGLKVCQDASREVSERMSAITCPILHITAGKDDVVNNKKCRELERQTVAPMIVNRAYNGSGHIMASKEEIRNAIKDDITTFLKDQCLSDSVPLAKGRVAAVVPAYNEEQRISSVLSVLEKVSLIDEIIVVDDGSTDNTSLVVGRHPRVRLMQNETNKGKAQSMDIGVQGAECDTIFFCDADIVGMKPSEITQIIMPVLRNETGMCLGIRKNKMQRIVNLFAVNTGERALRRDLWESLPQFFKHRFRIEAGLNYYARYHGGFTCRTMSYFQTLKEKKYGLLRGTYLRWRMNLDVLLAYLAAYLFYLPYNALSRTLQRLFKRNR